MKIVSIEAIPVRMPFLELASDSWGKYEFSDHGIVVVRGESGEYGVGEIALVWFGGAHLMCKEINEIWADQLVGMDVHNITEINKKLDYFCTFSKRHLLAKAGIEMAIWDLLGKTLDVPVYQLLGGGIRKELPLTGGVPMLDSVDQMIESAVQKVSEGYKDLKVKVGLDDRKDLEVVRQIRKAIPESVKIRVDVNMAWRNAKKAKEMMDELIKEGVYIFEQPLGDTKLNELSWLKKNTQALILIDEGVWDVYDAKSYLDMDAADLLHVYICEAGGISMSKKIFEVASIYDIDCTIGSMPEGRIGAAASAHIGAAMMNLSSHASDIRGFTIYKEDVVNEELEIVDGNLLVPDRPGLGVTVDFAKLDKLRVNL